MRLDTHLIDSRKSVSFRFLLNKSDWARDGMGLFSLRIYIDLNSVDPVDLRSLFEFFEHDFACVLY